MFYKAITAFLYTFVFFILSLAQVVAHEGEEHIETVRTLAEEAFYRKSSLVAIGFAAAFVTIAVSIATLHKTATESVKKILFTLIVMPIVLATIYLAGSTVYLNLSSSSKGPVHWHADFEIWDCGKKVDLIDPKGLSNRVGTSTFHEHGDNRIHVEGVVSDEHDANLGNFFKFVGGELHKNHFMIPTTEGALNRSNGDSCNNQPGTVQVFAYKTHGSEFSQNKLEDPPKHILAPYGNVPPGDCLIVEFDVVKERTDHLCDFYKLAIEQGKIHGP